MALIAVISNKKYLSLGFVIPVAPDYCLSVFSQALTESWPFLKIKVKKECIWKQRHTKLRKSETQFD